MPAIYRNLQSRCIEIIQFAFSSTLCNRVQMVQINLHHLEGRIAPGCKSLKPRSHSQNTPRVQIAHMNMALGKNNVLYVYLDNVAAICFRECLFLAKIAKNKSLKKIYSGLQYTERIGQYHKVYIQYITKTSPCNKHPIHPTFI